METDSISSGSDDKSDEDMTESSSASDREENQQPLPMEYASVNSGSRDRPHIKHHNSDVSKCVSSSSRDPCGTPKKFKTLFEQKLAELDKEDVRNTVSWDSSDDVDDEEEQLIPREKAPVIEKPNIVERPFEEEIKHLLKSIENNFPREKRDEEYHEWDMASKVLDIDLAEMPEDPDVYFQFEDRKPDITEEEMDYNLKILDDPSSAMVEAFGVIDRQTNSAEITDVHKSGPSSSLESSSYSKNKDMFAMSKERLESISVIQSDMDDMLMLPSLDSEDDALLAGFDRVIREMPLSQSSQSQEEMESAVPSTMSEDGVVLPVVRTLFDDTSQVPDEATLSGTFYEEALLPEIPVVNNYASFSGMERFGSTSSISSNDQEMVSLVLNSENGPVQSEGMFGGNVYQLERSSHSFRDTTSVPCPSLHEAKDSELDDSRVPSKETSESSLLPGINDRSVVKREEETASAGTEVAVVPDDNNEELLRSLGALPKAGTVGPPGQRRYDGESVVPWEEDQLREFKGHRNVNSEEIPPWCLVEPRTRSPISRNICGFLNTGMGGSIHAGILDNGVVRGEEMTLYQQDHLLLSLRDTLQRFKPPVPLHLVKTTFVPVLHPWDRLPDEHSASTLQYDEEIRRRPHKLRTYLKCWCDLEAAGRVEQGISSRRFVVEISVLPVDPDDPLLSHMKPKSDIRTMPVFQADDAQIYFRKHASTIKCSMRDIEEGAKDEVLLYKMPQLMSAWKEYLTYKKLVEVVQEALEHERDEELLERIRQVDRDAEKSTYRLVQERRYPLYT